MSAEAIIVCDLQDLKSVSMPPRSRLYCLEPKGIDTPYVESLTSYIGRLSRFHSVSPRTLILQEVLPLLKISDSLKQENRLAWLKGSTGLNGMTPLVEDWIQALEQLTLCNNLRFLTMLPWSNVINQSGVVRKIRAWCPDCYEEWLQTGQEIYEPLIWMLRAIVDCPKHQRPLFYQCPHQDCQRSIPLLDSWSEAGCCPYCGRFLGFSTVTEGLHLESTNVEEQEWNRWVSNTVGELLASSPSLQEWPKREMLASGITAYIEKTMGSSTASLALYLGVNSLELGGWQKGVHLPQFDTFLRLCNRMQLSPLNFLTRGLDAFAGLPSKMALTSHIATIKDRDLQQRLEAILRSEEFLIPSIEEVAKQLKYPVQVLQHKFSELCNAITQRYQRQLNSDSQRAFLERVLVEDELKHLSLNEVARRLGCRVTLLKYRFPEMCSQIAQRRHERKLDLDGMRLKLEEIIASSENPPPNISEVMLRLKCSHTTLYRHFPDLCHTITTINQDWLTAQRPKRERVIPGGNVESVGMDQESNQVETRNLTNESISVITNDTRNLSAKTMKRVGKKCHRKLVDVNELQRALGLVLASHEEPFPSVEAIAKQLGYTVSILYRYFPELCHAITERSRRPIEFDEVRQRLETILKSEERPFPNVRQVSKCIGYPENSLRRHFPEMCQAIIQRRRYGIPYDQPIPLSLPGIYVPEENKNDSRYKKQEELGRLKKALEAALDDANCPSMVEIAQTLGYSSSSLYHYFPTLCRAIAQQHKQQKIRELEHLKCALEDVLSCTEPPFPSMQEVARQLGCSHKILYNHFPELCHTIVKRHRPDLFQLQQLLDEILSSADPLPSINEVARRLECSGAVLRYYFPEQCKAIKERQECLNEVDSQRHALETAASIERIPLSVNEEVDSQRQALETSANTEQIPLSVNEIARRLGCPSSVLYRRFPELCQIITERRWKLSDSDKLRRTLEAALAEEPPPTVREIAKRLECSEKNLEYYFPDLCRAIAARRRESADRDDLQKSLEAFLTSEDPPISLQEVIRRLGVSNGSIRRRFPQLCRSISARYANYRRVMSEARIQKIREEVRQATFLLHAQGVYPNKSHVGSIISSPARFRMPEAREAWQEAMKELGYES